MTPFSKQLFDQLCDVPDIHALVSRQEAERLHLDFKQEPKQEDLQKIVGKAVTGFANADGGVLVFGVAERSGILEDRPLADATDFEQHLNTMFSRCVAFPVEGVVTRAILKVPGPHGYVVVHVPASDLAPHRSQVDKQYYRRVGESFVPMEHYEIADAFGRRHLPRLTLVALAKTSHPSAGKAHIDLTICFRNMGRGIAKYPRVKFERLSGSPFSFAYYELDGNGRSGLPLIVIDSQKVYQGGADHVVHPMADYPITKVQASYSQSPGSSSNIALRLEAVVSGESTPPFSCTIEITDAEIDALMKGQGMTAEFPAK